jgi:hypothetical protein
MIEVQPPYGEADLECEVAVKGIQGLSPQGKAYLTRIVAEDLARGRREWEARIAKREAEIALAAEITAAVASAGPEASESLPWRERQHQQAITRGWDAAGY